MRVNGDKEKTVKKLILVLIATMAITLMMASSAVADMHNYRLIAEADASIYTDFHVEITCPTAVISDVKLIKDPSPGGNDANVIVSGLGIGDVTIDIDWGGATLDAGAKLEIHFEGSVEELCVVEGYWTVDGEFSADAAIFIDEVPSLTEYGLIALAILIALTGLWMYRRKRATA